MKKVLFLMILLFLMVSGTATMNAQVKIGENAVPRKGAVLDLNGSYKGGLLLPNVEITDMGKIPNDFHDTFVAGKDEVLELAGLMVWNTGTGSEGVYVWDGKDWQVVSGGSVTPPVDCPAPATPGDITFDKTSIKVGETTTATCGAVDGATSYVWTLPAGLTADHTETATNNIVITGTAVQNYAAGSIKVKALNTCDGSKDSGSNDKTLSVVAVGPGSVAIGLSAECTSLTKSDCTCASGSPVPWTVATQTMKESGRVYTTSDQKWFVTSANGNQDSKWNYLGNFLTGTTYYGYMVCF